MSVPPSGDRDQRVWALLERCDLGELWAVQRWLSRRIAEVEAGCSPQEIALARATAQAPVRPPATRVGGPEVIQRYAGPVRDAAGRLYQVHASGQARADGTWEGWLEFVPAGDGPVRRTGQETTQPDRDALAYWASGLEPVYLEGAFARAQSAAGTPAAD